MTSNDTLGRAPFIAGVAAVFATPRYAEAADLTPVTVGVPPSDTAAIVYYAQQLGFFKAAGLDVSTSLLNSGPVIAAAVTGGSLNFGAVNVGSIAAARLRGLPLRIVAPSALVPAGRPSGDVVMVRDDSKLRPGPDFNNKTVAIVAIKTVQHAAFLNWLDKHGADSKSVKMIEIPLPEMVDSLDSGHVDAAIPVEPFTTQGLSKGNHSFGSLYEGLPSFMVFALCATDQWLAANAATAAKFALALRQAAVWANGHDAESRQLLTAFMKIDPQTAAKIQLRSFGTTASTELIAPVIDIMVKYGFLDRAISPAELIWQP